MDNCCSTFEENKSFVYTEKVLDVLFWTVRIGSKNRTAVFMFSKWIQSLNRSLNHNTYSYCTGLSQDTDFNSRSPLRDSGCLIDTSCWHDVHIYESIRCESLCRCFFRPEATILIHVKNGPNKTYSWLSGNHEKSPHRPGWYLWG